MLLSLCTTVTFSAAYFCRHVFEHFFKKKFIRAHKNTQTERCVRAGHLGLQKEKLLTNNDIFKNRIIINITKAVKRGFR